jgi:hypothetical protein
MEASAAAPRRWKRVAALPTAGLASLVLVVAAGVAVDAAVASAAAPQACSKRKSTPVPQDAQATPYLTGNAAPSLSEGSGKPISVVAVGPQLVNFNRPVSSLPLVVRNNTCSYQSDIEVSAAYAMRLES